LKSSPSVKVKLLIEKQTNLPQFLMPSLVIYLVALGREPPSAEPTLEGLLARVSPHVMAEAGAL
jgi:hypothetical protein